MLINFIGIITTQIKFIMSESFFIETSKHLYAFVQRLLKGLKNEMEICKDVEDIVQDSWKKLLEKYPELVDDESLLRPLVFVIAKREAFSFRRNFHKKKLEHSLVGEEVLFKSEENAYDLFIGEDMQMILQRLEAVQIFIWNAVLEYEDKFSQKEVVQMISDEYAYRFKKELTIHNYRTIKMRTSIQITKILSVQWL